MVSDNCWFFTTGIGPFQIPQICRRISCIIVSDPSRLRCVVLQVGELGQMWSIHHHLQHTSHAMRACVNVLPSDSVIKISDYAWVFFLIQRGSCLVNRLLALRLPTHASWRTLLIERSSIHTYFSVFSNLLNVSLSSPHSRQLCMIGDRHRPITIKCTLLWPWDSGTTPSWAAWKSLKIVEILVQTQNPLVGAKTCLCLPLSSTPPAISSTLANSDILSRTPNNHVCPSF